MIPTHARRCAPSRGSVGCSALRRRLQNGFGTENVAAIGIPAYAPVSQTCKGDLLRLDDIREACRGVANAFENGDTVITEMIGVAIAKRVWPEGSPEWVSATDRRRVYEYRSRLLRSVDPIKWNAAQAQKYLAFCLEQSHEQNVSREQ